MFSLIINYVINVCIFNIRNSKNKCFLNIEILCVFVSNNTEDLNFIFQLILIKTLNYIQLYYTFELLEFHNYILELRTTFFNIKDETLI